MKIVGISLLNFTDNRIDGVGYYVLRLMELAKHDLSSKYILFANERFNCKVFDLSSNNIEIVYCKFSRYKFINLLYKHIFLAYLFFKYQVNVAFFPAQPVCLIKLHNFRIITTVHDMTAFIVDRGQGIFFKYYYYLLVYFSLIRSDKVISVSISTKNDIIKIYKNFESKLCVIYPFLENNEIITGEYDKYFICISTIHPGKNIERLIYAFYEFHKVNSEYKLYIVGKFAWKSDNLINLVKSLFLDKYIIFTGYISESEKNNLLSNCLCLINISLYEGFGSPLIEAMKYFKPMILSNVSSFPEVGGNAAIFVNPLDINEIYLAMSKIIIQSEHGKLVNNISNQLQKFEPNIQFNLFKNLINGDYE